MKFTCSRPILDKQLQHLARIITTRGTLPVLSNVLVETDGKIVRLSGTDLDIAITTHMEADVAQEGTFTVPARVFSEFVHQNPDEEVSFHLESYDLVCTGAKVTARLTGIDADEYPSLPKVEGGRRVVLPAVDVVAAIKQVAIACANDASRPILTGVLLVLNGDRATFAATDSFRLVERSVGMLPMDDLVSIVIPSRSIQEVVRILGSMPEISDLELEVGETGILFKMGPVELYSRLLSGTFPKYQAIIPKTFQAVAEVTTSELVGALRLSSTFGQAGVANIMAEIAEDGTFTIASYGSKVGGASHTIYTVMEEGFTPLKAAFNVRFLLDACSSAGVSHVKLMFSGPLSPLVVSTGDQDYTQLVMPIRLDA